MKITISTYQQNWPAQFDSIKSELAEILINLDPQIEHIGSTSIPGLSAKSIIDILIAVNSEVELDFCIEPFLNHGYEYYPRYNDLMPYRRFFIRRKNGLRNPHLPLIITAATPDFMIDEQQHNRLAHIHVIPKSSEHFIRHLAFRDYLRQHDQIRMDYQQLKEKLGKEDWKSGNHYNAAKNSWIKRVESDAVKWYLKR